MESKENELLVGSKPFMAYIKSVEVLFKKKNLKYIVIKARGKNIGKAVDLAESSKNKFYKDLDLEISRVTIGTEKFNKVDTSKGNIELSVSTIELTIKRK